MNTPEDIIHVLGGLSDADRTWIIDRLSPRSRASLASAASMPLPTTLPARSSITPAALSSDTSNKPPASTTTSDVIALADATQIISILEREPAWVMHALLQQSWPWREEVRGLLPTLLRSEVESLENSSVQYSTRLIDSLKVKIANLIPNCAIAPKRARFDGLVASIGARVARKRLRISA